MAYHHADLAALQVNIHPKPRALRRGIGKVALHGGLELMVLRLAHDGVRHGTDILRGQHLLADGQKSALPLDCGGRPGQQEKIRGALAGHEGQAREQAAVAVGCGWRDVQRNSRWLHRLHSERLSP
jgi:hypothetical protein